MASAETDDLPDDMFDDDVNVTYDAGTTATTKGGILNNVTGDGIGGFVGGVVESVFQDEDVSEQVNDKVEGVGGIFSGIFDSFKDIIPSTNKQTTGSNFFDPITPAVTGGFNSNLGSNSNVQSNTLSSTNAAVNGEFVDYNTTVIPYAKPTAALNPGDKSDGVKWLQWILIYTECGLQNVITGEYDVDIKLPQQLEKVKLRFESIEEISADSLKGKGKLLTPAGRELAFETVVTFNGDDMSGYLKIAIANIKIKNGHRIG